MGLMRFMRRKGIASSLALLASVIILTVQICINMAFLEVMSEEMMRKAKEVVEGKDYGQLILIAVNETSLAAINRKNEDFLVSSISLWYLNGSMMDSEVKWRIPRMSMSICQVPRGLERCVAVVLRTEEGREVVLPLYRAAVG
ncbi:MAG: hypothetical protein LM598_05270 [Candidatus Verstraetearchaeota archaeon]|nr:hypothetical protein [Candidatus Verstraetearchaeota archaeon]